VEHSRISSAAERALATLLDAGSGPERDRALLALVAESAGVHALGIWRIAGNAPHELEWRPMLWRGAPETKPRSAEVLAALRGAIGEDLPSGGLVLRSGDGPCSVGLVLAARPSEQVCDELSAWLTLHACLERSAAGRAIDASPYGPALPRAPESAESDRLDGHDALS
jgi:hypothetical protein